MVPISIINCFKLFYIGLRNPQGGYVVSLLNAGARIVGRKSGDVKSPLVMTNKEDYKELELIITKGSEVLDPIV